MTTYYQSSTGNSFNINMDLEFFANNYGRYTAFQNHSKHSGFSDSGYFKYSGKDVERCNLTWNEIYHIIENPNNDKIPGNAIDLGLSVMWSDRNIGALSSEDIGYTYSWGEIESKHGNTDYTLNLGEMNISGTEYDVAHVKWGNKWRIPTKEDFEELLEKCNISVSIKNGKYCYNFIGPNGNKVTFMTNYDYSTDICSIMTATPAKSTEIYELFIYMANTEAKRIIRTNSRNNLYKIRPVCGY